MVLYINKRESGERIKLCTHIYMRIITNKGLRKTVWPAGKLLTSVTTNMIVIISIDES